MESLGIGIVGCAGRMGRMAARVIDETDGCTLAGGTEFADSAAIGRDLGDLAGIGAKDLPVGDDPAALFAAADAVIDFTAPAISVKHAELAAQAEAVLVLGTTGLDKEQDAAIARAARHATIVQAANMSLGVNVLLALVERAARSLDPDYDIEIVETHHRRKVDAPSGTAASFLEAVQAGRAANIPTSNGILPSGGSPQNGGGTVVHGRQGETGPRQKGEIGIHAIRMGDVVGHHEIHFGGPGETITISHTAHSRATFAAGALHAAAWLIGKPPGLYSMADAISP